MNILVYGAGAIGSLYARRLQDGGHNVTLLARAQRLADIRRYGVVLEDILSGMRTTAPVNTVEHLRLSDRYELIIVIVRRDQLASVVPELTVNRQTPTFLFMLNNPMGSSSLIETFGERVMLGFPGAGGTRDGHIVRYAMIAQQPTMLGEPSSQYTSRLNQVVEVFRSSGLKTRRSPDMDTWLKAHAFFVTAISGAIYLAGGDCQRLSKDDATLRLMVTGVREGFGALRALGLTATPFALRVLFAWLPSTFAVNYWRRFLTAETADYIFGRHSRAAPTEMRELAKDCQTLLEKANVEGAALHRLYVAIDAYAGQHPPTIPG